MTLLAQPLHITTKVSLGINERLRLERFLLVHSLLFYNGIIEKLMPRTTNRHTNSNTLTYQNNDNSINFKMVQLS